MASQAHPVPAPVLSSRRYLQLAFAAVLVLAAGILWVADAGKSQTTPGTGVYGEYSDDFVWWLYPTNQVAIDVSALRANADPEAADIAITRLKELAAAQGENNQRMVEAKAPNAWQPFHARILRAIEDYDAATADIRLAGQPEDFPSASARLEQQLTALLERVISCYAHAIVCR